MDKVTLCHLDEITESGCKGFQVALIDKVISLFVVCINDGFYGYINSCPHTGASLEWVEDQFLDNSKSFIQCANHGALFNIKEGLCISGPCVGQSLQPVVLSINKGILETIVETS